MSHRKRHIPLEGAKNFRDFGGYHTEEGRFIQEGLLFRSDGLSRLTAADFEKIAQFGIRTICDLRRDKERLRSPTNWQDTRAKIHHLPLLSETGPTAVDEIAAMGARCDARAARDIMVNIYRGLITGEQAQHYYRRMFPLLSEQENLPVLIHCSGGKDRTGVSCALILWFLGVPRADIIDNYLHSQPLYGDLVDLRKVGPQMFDHHVFADIDEEALRLMFGVQEEYIQAVFDLLDENNETPQSFIGQRLGLDISVLANIRKNLLTD